MRRALTIAAGAGFALPLAAAWHPAMPSTARLVVVATLAVAAISPEVGLLVVAALVPMALAIQDYLGLTSLAELLVLPFLAAAGLRLAFRRTERIHPLSWPVLLVGTLVAASGLLQLSALQQHTAWPAAFAATLWRHVTHTYFVDNENLGILHDVLKLAEGLALALFAAQVIARWPALGTIAARLLLVSGAVLTAGSARRLIQILHNKPQPLETLSYVLREVRINTYFTDINAAASLYVLIFVAALWMALRGWLWWLPAAVSGLAVWLAGSRAAFAGAFVATGLNWIVARRPRPRLLLTAAAVCLALVAVGALVSERNAAPSTASGIRLETARAAIELFRQAPVFGVGLSRFKPMSASLFSPESVRQYSMLAGGQNAHNNFLQVLAELGAFGLAGFLWLLTVPLRAGWRAAMNGTASPELLALCGGLAAFLVTCLLGHPLMTEHVSLVFMETLGITAGLALGTSPGPVRGWTSYLAAAVVAVAIACVPFRLVDQRRTTPLAGTVLGASAERGMLDAVPYRTAEQMSSWFVNRDTRAIEIPVRLSAGSPATCPLDVTVNGNHADTALPTSSAWLRVPIQLTLTPPTHDHRVDLHVAHAGCTLLVGEFTAR